MALDHYEPSYYGKEEVEDHSRFWLQMQDSRGYFLQSLRPRFDRHYKQYVAYGGDRAREIKTWQSNVTTPYVQAVVETLMPRILDARPEFAVQGRNSNSQLKAPKQQMALDYFWEKAEMDRITEEVVRSSLVYGTGYLQPCWKKDVREMKFLKSADINSKKYEWKKEKKVVFDGPIAVSVDPYSLWYDWHNTEGEAKQYWFHRTLMTEPEIRQEFTMADPQRLKLALAGAGLDLNDYATVRLFTKPIHESTVKGVPQFSPGARGYGGDKYQVYQDMKLKFYEVFKWWRPYEDKYSVVINYVPILPGGSIPIPYDWKVYCPPFIDIPYMKLPYEFEGQGIPAILENTVTMLNTLKNQRIDETTLSIHKMWIVNPLANVNKDDLVARPFGIIYTPDPNGVREVQFSDIKESAYREEELLKSDMRYASGVDDTSMGAGGGGSATEVRHLRESTLERVRLFVNHMGDAYSKLARCWMSMQKQFFTEALTMRIVGDDGQPTFPLIEEDDLQGEFDYRCTVLPSIAGQNDMEKKQNMDLFQLLITLPFIDQRKLVKKVLEPWNFSLESVMQDQQGAQPGSMGPDGQPAVGPDGQPLPPEAGQGLPTPPELNPLPTTGGGKMTPAMMQALGMMQPEVGPGSPLSGFSAASSPIPMQEGVMPPTVPDMTRNPRGFNRTGAVNTDISQGNNSSPESALLTAANSPQRKKK